MSALVLPMSISSVFERRYEPIRLVTMSRITRTGAARITTSASLTPALRSSVATSTMPCASAYSRAAGFISTPVIVPAYARSASASDPPIKPKPTTAR